MNNQNNNSNYVRLGAGWEKYKEDGSLRCISFSLGDKKAPKRFFVVHEDGTQEEITGFAVFPNTNKKENKHPDFNVVYSRS